MFDLVIKGGRILSGTGDPWYHGDVGIHDGRIVKLGKIKVAEAKRFIDAAKRVVSPGFIDMHSHSDLLLLANPRHEPKIMQGITTELIGLDGLSYAPLSGGNLMETRRYLAALNGNPDIPYCWSSVREFLRCFDGKVATNVAYLVPHNALRLGALGFVNRLASDKELEKMQELAAQGMGEGAVGVSFGLDYYPGRYCDTKELIAICCTVADLDGISVWHTRLRDLGLLDSLREVFSVAVETHVRVHLSHFSASGPENKGKAGEILAMVDNMRERGFEVTFDSYPYDASSSTLILFFPGWVHEGGPDAMLERLADSKLKARICAELKNGHVPWDKVVVSCVGKKKNLAYMGRSLWEGARISGKDTAEFLCDLVLDEELNAGYLGFTGSEEDLRRILTHPCHTLCSDGLLVGSKPNPRGWGSFPRFLGHYQRELGLLALEEAVRHITSAPAQCLRLYDRGLVKEGFAADLVVFDPDSVLDQADFEKPKEFPIGIDYVIVNGEIVVEKGCHTGALAGKVLRKK